MNLAPEAIDAGKETIWELIKKWLESMAM